MSDIPGATSTNLIELNVDNSNDNETDRTLKQILELSKKEEEERNRRIQEEDEELRKILELSLTEK
jgi:hypothetical protein